MYLCIHINCIHWVLVWYEYCNRFTCVTFIHLLASNWAWCWVESKHSHVFITFKLGHSWMSDNFMNLEFELNFNFLPGLYITRKRRKNYTIDMHVGNSTILVAWDPFLFISSWTDGGLPQDLYFTVLSMPKYIGQYILLVFICLFTAP